MNNRNAAMMLTASAISPPCFGRRQGDLEKVVKGRWQALQPAVPRYMCTDIGDAGHFYIEGCHTPRAAIQTLAGHVRTNGGRLPQLREGQGRQIQRGAITKPKAKKIETVLSASRFQAWIC